MQYNYRNSENIDLSLSVPHNNGFSNMNDQTFHTPNFGDEDFDIPHHNQSQLSYQQNNVPPHSQAQNPMTMNPNDPGGYPSSMHLPHSQEHNMGLSSSASYSSPSYTTMTTVSNSHHSHQQQQEQQRREEQQRQQQHQQQQHQQFMQQMQQQQQQQQQQQYHYMTMGPASYGSHGRSAQGSSPVVNSVVKNEFGEMQPPCPAEQNTTTSDDSDDSTPHAQMIAGMKRPSPEPVDNGLGKIQKVKPKSQKKKKKRDPNEPTKPVSAYALFFRDTQAAIKGQNPNASFGEVSKIVASMWDSLDAEHKNVYKKKTEAAKKDYLKALAAYRASLVSKGANEADNMYSAGGYGGYGGGYSSYSPPTGLPSPPMSNPMSPHQLPPPGPPGPAAGPPGPPGSMASAKKQPLIMSDNRGNVQTQQGMMGGHMGQQTHLSSQQQQQQVNPSNNYIQQPNQQQVNNCTGPPPSNVVTTTDNNMDPPQPTMTCIRSGCTNPSVVNSEWEDEYCSNECVVTHCRNVFQTWVASNQSNS
ncbi:uncharacterized protein [Bemisia tabaci]|uniref:uncharacterized protein isoform X2 n=1 Tax=Bemisia tabaci TaxID=7038 RepID=UPI003B28585F